MLSSETVTSTAQQHQQQQQQHLQKRLNNVVVVLAFRPLSKGDLGSISPTFYEQLLRLQIPKEQKSCLTWQSFLRFWYLCL